MAAWADEDPRCFPRRTGRGYLPVRSVAHLIRCPAPQSEPSLSMGLCPQNQARSGRNLPEPGTSRSSDTIRGHLHPRHSAGASVGEYPTEKPQARITRQPALLGLPGTRYCGLAKKGNRCSR
ncbi:hypothetical protein BD413DRAFT_529314 [Trametes elegans]|nr:hypothetical protein BD413DRAFT_529314 [Trametes elegans]